MERVWICALALYVGKLRPAWGWRSGSHLRPGLGVQGSPCLQPVSFPPLSQQLMLERAGQWGLLRELGW